MLAGIDTPDDRTVVFRFKQPYAPLLLQLDATEAPIVAKHVYQGSDPQTNPANANPVGHRALRFVSYERGRRSGWPATRVLQARLALPRRARDAIIPDAGTQVLALENGEVDFLWGVPGPHQARLRADPRIRMAQTVYHPGGSNCIMTVSFNLDRPS